ncbi:MAG: nucleotidyltransferase family protein [Burkholderiaceae bacterium]|nr:nucleotidyltransferase family protein [Burkholderiaceae bacterium]
MHSGDRHPDESGFIVPAAGDAARLGAVLLAAGSAVRMGGPNKLLMRVDGEPLVRRSLRALQRVPIGHLVVVLGRDAQRVRMELDTFPVRAFCRVDVGCEQQVSVDAGLRALPAGLDAIVLALADQPLVETDDLRWLLAQWRALPAGSAAIPFHGGARGNPVVIAGAMREPVLEAGPSTGCRGWLAAHPQRVHRIEAPNDHFVVDLDTPEDAARLARRGLLVEPPPNGETPHRPPPA